MQFPKAFKSFFDSSMD